MEKILILAHTQTDGSLSASALEALGAAQKLAQDLTGGAFEIGLVGENVQPAADSIAACGASRILGVYGPDFGSARYATDAAAAESICKAAGATLVIVPATPRWNRCIAGVAQRLGGRVDTHLTGISSAGGQISVNRWFYRQRMESVISRSQRPWFLAVDPGTQTAATLCPGKASIQSLTVNLSDSHKRTTVVALREPTADAQTIRPEANLLFVTGAGWTKKQADGQPHVKEAETLILGFLRGTRASLGSTKSLVDLGGEGQQVLFFLTHLNQVGQTGSTPRHQKGLATCCHGEEPHTVGWRFINERRAVNLDPNCGWARGKADVLYIADAFAVIKKLNELLAK